MTEKNTFTRRTKTLIIAVSVLLFLVLCLFGAELWLKHEIRTVIEKEATALTDDGGMQVGVGRISVGILTRTVSVRDIRLRSQNEDPEHSGFTLVSLDAGVRKISLRGIGYKKNNGKPALSAVSVEIDAPYATVVTKGEKPEKEGGAGKKTLQQSITEKLSSITVGSIRISRAKLEYVAWKDSRDGTRIGLENGGLKIDGLMVDSLPAAAGKVLFSDGIAFTAGRVSYGYDAGDFVLQADTLSLNTADGSFYVKTAALIPQYPKDEFAQKSPEHSDWTEFTLRELICSGVGYAALVNDKTLTVDSLSFASGRIASYKNRQVWQEPRVKPLLYQTIQDLPFGIDVKKMSFTGLDVEYDELALDGDSPGVVTFTKGVGTAHNITNIVENHDRFMTIDMAADFMANSPLHAVLHFPVNPQDNRWEAKGKLGVMDPVVLNRAIEPLANIKVKTGTIQSIDFHITATPEQSHTALTMLYDDLSVAFMKKHEGKERRFITFIADEMILRKSNPGNNGNVRQGEGDFTRDPHKSMYNFMWKSLFQGIKDTVL